VSYERSDCWLKVILIPVADGRCLASVAFRVSCCTAILRLAYPHLQSLALLAMTSSFSIGNNANANSSGIVHMTATFHSHKEANKILPQTIKSTLQPACNIVTPVGMLGFGLHTDHTFDALRQKVRTGAPTAIILDSGSTDSGPEKLALGRLGAPRESYIRDLKKLIRLSCQFRVPLIFSSAGGDGSDDHVRELTEIVKGICESDEGG
jgi:hypothetical protein